MTFLGALKAFLVALPTIAGASKELAALAREVWRAIQADIEAKKNAEYVRNKAKEMADGIRKARLEKDTSDINRLFGGL